MSALRLAGAVFDADGTLFDTERLALEVWLGVAREFRNAVADLARIVGERVEEGLCDPW